jgi:hypothetical protein
MTDAERIAKKYAKLVIGLDVDGTADFIVEAIREGGRLYLKNVRDLVEKNCWFDNEGQPYCRYCEAWKGNNHLSTCLIEAIKYTEDVLEMQNAANYYLLHQTRGTKTRPNR